MKNNLFQQLKTFSGVLAIDGRCGSGKTTFAKKLENEYGFGVVHLDDFFLPIDKRTDENFETIGGNIDKERFMLEVLSKIGTDFSYRKFSCKTQKYGISNEILAKKPLVIEGVYTMMEDFLGFYDKTLFFDINKNEQKARIIKRNGSFNDFENIWIPKEEHYIKESKIDLIADMIIDGGKI